MRLQSCSSSYEKEADKAAKYLKHVSSNEYVRGEEGEECVHEEADEAAKNRVYGRRARSACSSTTGRILREEAT